MEYIEYWNLIINRLNGHFNLRMVQNRSYLQSKTFNLKGTSINIEWIFNNRETGIMPQNILVGLLFTGENHYDTSNNIYDLLSPYDAHLINNHDKR